MKISKVSAYLKFFCNRKAANPLIGMVGATLLTCMTATVGAGVGQNRVGWESWGRKDQAPSVRYEATAVVAVAENAISDTGFSNLSPQAMSPELSPKNILLANTQLENTPDNVATTAQPTSPEVPSFNATTQQSEHIRLERYRF